MAFTLILSFLAGGCQCERRADAPGATVAAQTVALKNPFADRRVSQPSAETEFKCPETPAPSKDVEGVMFYKDELKGGGHLSIIDPKLYEKSWVVETPFRDFAQQTADAANAIWITAGKNEAAKTCFKEALLKWANAEAMTGTTSAKGFQRLWTLSTVALTDLRTRSLVAWTSEERTTFETWVKSVALVVRDDFASPETLFQKNSTSYWAALAMMSSAIVVQDRDLYNRAFGKAYSALNTVDTSGFLPFESLRGSRAWQYHGFALDPLMMMAHLSAENGDDLYTVHDNALLRLADRVLIGYRDDESFRKVTGFRQEKPDVKYLAWTELYFAHFAGKKDEALLKEIRPVKEKWLGGNQTEMMTR